MLRPLILLGNCFMQVGIYSPPPFQVTFAYESESSSKQFIMMYL